MGDLVRAVPQGNAIARPLAGEVRSLAASRSDAIDRQPRHSCRQAVLSGAWAEIARHLRRSIRRHARSCWSPWLTNYPASQRTGSGDREENRPGRMGHSGQHRPASPTYGLARRWEREMTRRIKWIFALFAAFAAFDVAALATLMIVHRPPGAAISWKGGATGTPDIGGPFTLKTTDGKTVTEKTYRGKWVAVFFGYTFCPDACPTALSNMSVALGKLGKDAEKIQPLFITVDPDRDTSEVMSAFLDSFDHHIVGLLGTRSQMDGVARADRAVHQMHKEDADNWSGG